MRGQDPGAKCWEQPLYQRVSCSLFCAHSSCVARSDHLGTWNWDLCSLRSHQRCCAAWGPICGAARSQKQLPTACGSWGTGGLRGRGVTPCFSQPHQSALYSFMLLDVHPVQAGGTSDLSTQQMMSWPCAAFATNWFIFREMLVPDSSWLLDQCM